MLDARATHKPRVLVVDDDELVATTTCMILNRCGFFAVAAFSAEDALLLAHESAFDVLITDVMMEPTNGIQLAMAFRGIHPSAHILLLSGQEAAAALLVEAARIGFKFPALAKPVDPRLLLDTLNTPVSVDSSEKLCERMH